MSLLVVPARLHIVSCGVGLTGYLDLSKAITASIASAYSCSTVHVYGNVDFPDWIHRLGAQYGRGYGYWSWKPFCISEVLEKAQDGEIIFYVDGRCCSTEGQRLPIIDAIVNDETVDISACQMAHIEEVWSRADLMNEFGVVPGSQHAVSGQFAATYLVLRVNIRTRLFARRWLSFVREHLNLINDEVSTLPNAGSFRENRHDQSAFSMLLKTTEGLKVHVHSPSKMEPLCPHVHRHPTC